MNVNDRFRIALVKYAYPICGKVNEDASSILLNKELTKKAIKLENLI